VTVSLVWAQAHDRVIGAAGRLPWRLPEDLRLFRELTTGSTVVMGRRTWESLPDRSRPLPGRTNVVLTATRGWTAHGAVPVRSVEQVLAEHRDCWVIGGAAVYAAFLPHAQRAVVTEIDLSVDGDTRAPTLGQEWRLVSRTPTEGWTTSAAGGLRFAVCDHRR
jgi:dihydrofolate reductase